MAAMVAWYAALFAAIVLRFRNLGWGDGPVFDEIMYWRVPLSSFAPLVPAKLLEWSLNYPTLFGYLAGASVGAAQALGFIGQPSGHYFDAVVVARGVSASAGVASVVLLGALGRRIESRAAGLLAAALLAFVPIEVTQTHYISVDVLENTFVVLTMLGACVLVQCEGYGWALLAGAAGGLAFVTKYGAVVVLVAPGWAVLEIALHRRSLRPMLTFGAVALLGFLVAVFAGCPPCVLNFAGMRAALAFHTSNSFSSAASSYGANLSPEIGWYARPYLYQLLAGLPFVLGWPLYVLSLAGVVAAVIRHRATDRVVLSTLVAFFGVIAGSPIVYPRYLLPLVPGLVVLAAILVARLAGQRRTWLLVVALVWLYTAALSWTLTTRYSRNQQTAVAKWLEQQVERCGRQGVELVVAHPRSPYFGLWEALHGVSGVKLLPQQVGHWFDTPPDVFVVPDWLAIAIGLKRMLGNEELERDLARLRMPGGEYVAAAHWSSSYLQKGFYTWLDPSFDATLEQGEIGFTAYVRRSLACIEKAPPEMGGRLG